MHFYTCQRKQLVLIMVEDAAWIQAKLALSCSPGRCKPWNAMNQRLLPRGLEVHGMMENKTTAFMQHLGRASTSTVHRHAPANSLTGLDFSGGRGVPGRFCGLKIRLPTVL